MDTHQHAGPKGVSFWILIGVGALLNIIYLMGQTMAVINYEFTVSIGLQEPIEEITALGVAWNQGFGLGDTIVYIPLFISGIIGLLNNREFGIYCMMGALSITIYWTIVSMSTLYYARKLQAWDFSDYTSYFVVLGLIVFYGIWGLWYVYKNRRKLYR